MSLKTLEQYAQQAAAAYKSYLTEEDTQECASFLLALKHRSVTPEPPEIDDERPSTSDRSCIPDVQVPKHQPEPSKKIYDSDDGAAQNAPALLDEQLTGEASLDALLGDSQLVFPSDRDLVPDHFDCDQQFDDEGKIIVIELSVAIARSLYSSYFSVLSHGSAQDQQFADDTVVLLILWHKRITIPIPGAILT